jgi:hypothetical protein
MPMWMTPNVLKAELIAFCSNLLLLWGSASLSPGCSRQNSGAPLEFSFSPLPILWHDYSSQASLEFVSFLLHHHKYRLPLPPAWTEISLPPGFLLPVSPHKTSLHNEAHIQKPSVTFHGPWDKSQVCS